MRLLVFDFGHVRFVHFPYQKRRNPQHFHAHNHFLLSPNKVVEMPGTAPGSKTSIPQRLQNHHRLRDMPIILFSCGNCKFLSYNEPKRQ